VVTADAELSHRGGKQITYRDLALAEPQGYMRIFLDEGEPIQKLLTTYQSRPGNRRLATYAQKLRSAFDIPNAPPGQQQSAAQDLADPLSTRELDVLRLVTAGASNKDIADQLFIAVSTVKKHVSNILVKLDAPNRVQAIARARELNLIS